MLLCTFHFLAYLSTKQPNIIGQLGEAVAQFACMIDLAAYDLNEAERYVRWFT